MRRKQSSGMWRRVDVVLTDVSEERISSIFRVEGKIRKSASEKTVRAGASRLMSEIITCTS
jgi:predicted transcriptional regulator